MSRMGLDFDIRGFIEDMKACKPPYKCPWEECGKVYKTFSGMSLHLTSSHGNSGEKVASVPEGGPFYKSPLKESLTYLETDKILEFEAEGKLQKVSVSEPLKIMSRKVWEASLPPDALSTERRKPSPTPDPPKSSKKRRAAATSTHELDETPKKHSSKLPEAVFSVIPNYYSDLSALRSRSPPLHPDRYYTFVEKSPEVLDKEVEYDMDEEDVAWLDLVNRKRASENLSKVSEDQFELLMDRLEKESYFHVQSNGLLLSEFSQPIDDDAICCVCMDGECSNTNVILFCDLCNLAVHQECYGVPYIPEGQWLCRRCLQSPSRSVECCLCPNRGGAFKQTDDGRWAHVVCGLWIPEVRFANTVFLEPIDSIDNIPPARWKLSCRVCKQRGAGACIQCHKTNCYTAFHVTCGLLAGLHMKMDTVRESSATGLSVTVRKTAFCDVHTPADSDCKPKLDDIASLGISTPKTKARGSPKKSSELSPLPVLFRGLMNFSPQCPWDKVQEIASLINVPKKNQFFERLMAYWTLKRQTRNGVPLIRRLQFAKATTKDKSPETPQKNAHLSRKKKESPSPKETKNKSSSKSKKTCKPKDTFKTMLEHRKLLRQLRQDLEKVRLLCELIRKREQRKRELIVIDEKRVAIELTPLPVFLGHVIDSLESFDTHGFFGEPVSIEDVPDYLDHIKHPMDFSTMRSKLNHYKSIDCLRKDFTLVYENCLSYNEKDTIFYKAGVKLRDSGENILKEARKLYNNIGFDSDGLLFSSKSKGKASTDESLMKEIDEFLSDKNPLKKSDSAKYLKKLFEYQNKANSLSQFSAKSRRLRALKQEIAAAKRRKSTDRTKSKDEAPPPSGSRKFDFSLEEDDESEKKMIVNSARKLRTSSREGLSDSSTPLSKKRGRKRLSRLDDDEEDDDMVENNAAKKAKPSESPRRDNKDNNNKSQQLPAAKSSPMGVNRRNAVLFTRKKISASQKEDESVRTSKRKGSSDDFKKGSAKGSVEHMEVDEIPSSQMDEDSNLSQPLSPPSNSLRKRCRRSNPPSQTLKSNSSPPKVLKPSPKSSNEKRDPLSSSSFQHYRRGGVDEVGETDEDTQSESATDAMGTSESESESDSDSSCTESSGGGVGGIQRLPLEPLDLVWAKTRGYPWYPALIINPKMPRTGYLHNGVPIPVPPQDVLDMASSHSSPHYLILFFDSKRTWQWLQRDKLEPLGIDSKLDKSKLIQAKKPSEKKAVKKAYEDAIVHRCKVTGENPNFSEESPDEKS